MTDFAIRSRRTVRRHAEALWITAFILADCFASGWFITAGTIVALLYLIVPAAKSLSKFTSAAEQVTFVKAYVKTRRVQRVALMLFWIYSTRVVVSACGSANLFSLNLDGELPSIGKALFVGAQQCSPLAFLFTPVVFYVVACFIAIWLRGRLKSKKQDPDLVKQRQSWSGMCHLLFLCAFIAGILSIVLNVNGPGYMISNWLLASARDANLFSEAPIGAQVAGKMLEYFDPSRPMLPPVDTAGVFLNRAFVYHFDFFIMSSLSVAIFVLISKPVLRLHSVLTSFCWRVVSVSSLQNMIEAFLEALRLPSRSLLFKEAHPLFNNTIRTIIWLIFCYCALLWLFGFCGGPLGYAIQSWMIASGVDAGIGGAKGAPQWLYEPSYRIFLGSIVALYGTAPIAISAAVFLPHAMARKITVNCDGLLFDQGPYLALWGRQFRLWSDLESFCVKSSSKKLTAMQSVFVMKFRSGGKVSFCAKQVSLYDIKVILEGIDEHACDCTVDPSVYEVLKELQAELDLSDCSSPTPDRTIAPLAIQEYKSTIFIPFASGEILPESQIRVIKQLSSKPLCAVYLARDQNGRMLTVKQFYLAEDNEETRALAKIMQREYELLSSLDHPGIAKVVNSFTHEKSTFLLIEHRLGSDMREIVREHGPRSEALTIEWAKQLASIMIYLHGREPAITHRDLTPDNVIVGEDGQLRLIDFGAAREFLQGISGTMIGKHCYVAPEQLRGEASPRSDIYSFGATLYFLLTGRDPVALSQSSPAKNIDCSEKLDELIRKCTSYDEADRPQNFEEVMQALSTIDGGFRLKLPQAQKELV